MLRPVTSSLHTSNLLKKAESQAKSIPLGCVCPSHLSHSHSPPHARSKPKPWGPFVPLLHHRFLTSPWPSPPAPGHCCGIQSRESPQASGVEPGNSRGEADNISKSEHKQAVQAQPCPPSRLQAVAWAKQKGSKHIPLMIPGDPWPPNTVGCAGSCRARLTPPCASPPGTFPFCGFLVPLPTEKSSNYQYLTCVSSLGATKAHLW